MTDGQTMSTGQALPAPRHQPAAPSSAVPHPAVPRSTNGSRPGRLRMLAVAAVALLAGPTLVGCEATDSLLGREANGGPLDCSRFQAKAPETDSRLLMIMLDVSDNSPETANRISGRVRPYLDAALREGQYIKLVASGGMDSGLTYSDCFTGNHLFLVDRRNDTREEKDRAAALNALAAEVDHVVQEQRVTPAGSVTGLLSGVNDEVATLRSTPDVRIGEVTVLVWSDLLGTGGESDCLNVDGKTASVQIAEAMVKRCFSADAQQLTSLGEDQVRFIGVNEKTVTRPQQDMARYLKGELCRWISSDCG